MVFIKDEINRLRKKLLNDITDIDVYLYNYIRGNENNTDIVIPNNFRELAICGYSNKTIDEKIMNNILSRPPVKNMDFRSNIYELIGIFLLKRNDAKLENDLIRKQKEYEQKQEQIRELKEKFNGALSAENWKDVIEVGKKLLTCDKDNSVEDIIRSAEKKLRLSAVQIAFDEAFENENWASLVQIVADNPELKTVAGNNKSIQFARRQLIFTKNSSKESGTKKTGRTKVSYPLHSQKTDYYIRHNRTLMICPLQTEQNMLLHYVDVCCNRMFFLSH